MDVIKQIESIADLECTCTPDQQTGKDPSFCKLCSACSVINRLYEIAGEELYLIEIMDSSPPKMQGVIGELGPEER